MLLLHLFAYNYVCTFLTIWYRTIFVIFLIVYYNIIDVYFIIQDIPFISRFFIQISQVLYSVISYWIYTLKVHKNTTPPVFIKFAILIVRLYSVTEHFLTKKKKHTFRRTYLLIPLLLYWKHFLIHHESCVVELEWSPTSRLPVKNIIINTKIIQYEFEKKCYVTFS